MTDKPRIGDPAPEDMFDPLDAISFLLDSSQRVIGVTVINAEDMRAIKRYLTRAKKAQAEGDARLAQLGTPTVVSVSQETRDRIGSEATPNNFKVFVHVQLARLEQAIDAISDQAGGRIATLEIQTEQHRRSIWQVASDLQDLKPLAKRLEEAEADHSRLQSRVIELEKKADIQRANMANHAGRIQDLEAAVAELRRRLEPEPTYSIHDNVIRPPHKETP